MFQWREFVLVRRLAPVGRYCSSRDTFSSGASVVRWGDLPQWEVFGLVGRLCSGGETCRSGKLWEHFALVGCFSAVRVCFGEETVRTTCTHTFGSSFLSALSDCCFSLLFMKVIVPGAQSIVRALRPFRRLNTKTRPDAVEWLCSMSALPVEVGGNDDVNSDEPAIPGPEPDPPDDTEKLRRLGVKQAKYAKKMRHTELKIRVIVSAMSD